MDTQRYQELVAVLPTTVSRIGEAEQFTVLDRDLMRFLGATKNRISWCKDQIVRADLVENRDFGVLTLQGKNPQGGRPQQEYRFTFDAAKKVCMMSEAKKGDEVREYFLECERRAHAASPPSHTELTLEEWVLGLGPLVLQRLKNHGDRITVLEDTVEGYGFRVDSLTNRLALKDQHDRERDAKYERDRQALIKRLERQQLDQVDQSRPAKETQQPPPPDWMTLWQYRDKHKPLDIHSLSDNEVKALHKCVKVYGSPHKFKLAASDRGPSNFYDPFWIQKGIKDFVRQKLMKVTSPKHYEKQLGFDDVKKQG